MSMNIDDVLATIQGLREDKAEAYKYWKTSKKKMRASERAMTLATYARQLEALDRVITILLNQQADTSQTTEQTNEPASLL
jgi:hypothetical protein